MCNKSRQLIKSLLTKNCNALLIESLQKYQPYRQVSGELNKYECLTDKEILHSNQKQIIEQKKYKYSTFA